MATKKEKVEKLILRVMGLEEYGKLYPPDKDGDYCANVTDSTYECFTEDNKWEIDPGWMCTRKKHKDGIHVAHSTWCNGNHETYAAWFEGEQK